MEDRGDTVQLLKEVQVSNHREAIGLKVLGEVDPATLTFEQFDNNPNLLYHGSAEPFEFKPSYDYRSAEYCTNTDGSQTLGEGFYTTDLMSSAENYSIVRQNKNDAKPIVTKVLPYQARMFDFRSIKDPGHNALVPEELFNKWYQYYRQYHDEASKRDDLPWNVRGMESEYLLYLVRAKRNFKDIREKFELRVMLATTPFPQLQSPSWPSPPYMKLFSNFMKEQGYDGLVSVEGGEGVKKENHPSYVFFNLDKIGSYDSWKTQQSGVIASPISK